MENRFKMLTKSKPEDAKRFLQEAKQEVSTRWSMYEYMAARGAEKKGEKIEGRG
jgi:pyruvate-ferredoxin/flavodoxin oxidoreductase